MGTLYLVATPIGNLEDITFRAVRILNEVDLIAAEDTRIARRLLDHYGISTAVTSYHDNSPQSKLDRIHHALTTGDVALISDAGMPAISDPGNDVVATARRAGHPVIPIPGPSAVTAAAAVATGSDRGFIFGGFLPRKPAERRARLQSLAGLNLPVILFESPNRIEKLLDLIEDALPEATVLIGREITKIHEEWREGKPADLRSTVNPRGEFTVVVTPNLVEHDPSIERVDELLDTAFDIGLSVRDASALIAQALEVPRNAVYQRAISKRAPNSG
ncbi:MAG: 16S rRNA (cytidine(1402)-2'-O)-methyltransferase [Chloroflexota bacterium]